MKVLLINPNFEPPHIFNKKDLRNTPSLPPVLSIGTYLKEHGHDVVILDRIIDMSMSHLIEEAKKADLIGLSVMTAQVTDALKISDAVKKNTDAKVVFGGIHPTLFPTQTCRDPSVDFVIMGEGETTMLDLVTQLKKGDFKNVDGLVYKKSGKVIKNSKRKPMDIKKLPPIDYTLIDTDLYMHRYIMSGKKVKSLCVISSRGCPHRCSFCFHVLGDDTFYRYKDPETTIEEMKDLKKKYGINDILFLEDNFLANRKRVEKLLRLMIEEDLQLSWKVSCRANYFRKGHVDDELMVLMKRAGCAAFSIGAEHGSPKMLEIMKKDITPKQILNSAKACHKHGFNVSYSFMFGVPGETRKDIAKTLNLLKRIRKACPKAFGGVNVFRPYPGGDLYGISMEAGRIRKPESLRDWTKKKYINLMTTQSDIPWTKDHAYTKKITFYCAYFFFSNEKLISYMKVNTILGVFFGIFVMGVRARFATNFFGLPIDKFIFERATKMLGYEL